MALVLNYSCPNFRFFVGNLDITKAVTGFRAAQNKFEIGSPLIWKGAITLVDLPIPHALAESLDYLVNPGRWARGRHPVKIYFWNDLFLTLRINTYFYDPDTREAEAQLTDILGLVGSVERSPSPMPAVKTSARMDVGGTLHREPATWNQVALGVATKGSVVNNSQYIRPAQVLFPPIAEGEEVPSYSLTPQLSANPVEQLANVAMGAVAAVPWCDRNENIRFAKYPTYNPSPSFRLSRAEVEDFKRLPPNPDEAPTKVSVSGSGMGLVAPEPRGQLLSSIPTRDDGHQSKPKKISSTGDGRSFQDPANLGGQSAGINQGLGIVAANPNWQKLKSEYGKRSLAPSEIAKPFLWQPGQDPDKDPFTDLSYGS